jgi:hypothetical protein
LQNLTTEWMDDASPEIGCGRTQPICQHVHVMQEVSLAQSAARARIFQQNLTHSMDTPANILTHAICNSMDSWLDNDLSSSRHGMALSCGTCLSSDKYGERLQSSG